MPFAERLFRWFALALLTGALVVAALASPHARADEDVQGCASVRYGNFGTAVNGPCTRPCVGFPGGPGVSGVLLSSTYDIFACVRGL
jgi:hypothetical protein